MQDLARWVVACLLLLPIPGDLGSLAGATQTGDHVLVCVGDVMLGRGVAQALAGEWSAAFAGVRPELVQADLALANLESPLTTARQLADGYDLRAPPVAVTTLSAAGFDLVSLANNHAQDAGPAGLNETIAALDAAGILHAPPAAGVVGQGIVLVAFDDSAGRLDLQAASEAVGAASGRAELVIASVHWGAEYQATPTSRQRVIAAVLADAGADVVIGHGPHVLQPVEWLDQTLVAYSLGNFLFDQPYPKDLSWGAIISVRLQDGRAVEVRATPTVVEHGRVRVAEADEYAVILQRLRLDPGWQSGEVHR